jgi:uncharacterized protein (DUF58 family)
MSANSLINADLLGKLELLEVAFRRAQRGRPEGERSGAHRGGRIEFADYREYSPGDDFRHVDWNVLSRTDDLVVKQFEREEQYQVCLLLDRSASMGFPQDNSAPTKLEYGAACLAALGYIALAARHRVELGAFADGETEWFPVGADKERIFGLIDYLGKLTPAGGTATSDALEALAERSREKCLAVLVTDLLDGDHAQGVITALAAKGFDLSIIHVVSKEEVEPMVRGRTVLRDAETGRAVPLRITDASAAAYGKAFREFGEQWSAVCRKHGVRFLSTTTDVPFEDFVMSYLRHGGLVR